MKLNMARDLISLPGHDEIPFEQGAGLKVEGVGMNKLGPRKREGLVYHRAQGWGSVGWLLNPEVNGLTDWVISEKSDATMTHINFITGTNRDLAGWAQGPFQRGVASVDGKSVVDTYGNGRGGDTINIDLDSIEIMGFYDDPVHDNCKRDVAQWTAHHAQNDGIPWSQFPIRNNGVTFIFGHREFCGEDFKPCPGSVAWTFVNGELIERVQSLLRSVQTGASTRAMQPVYRKPRVPEILTESPFPEHPTLNGKRLKLVNKRFKATEPAPCCVSGSRTADRTRRPMAEGEDTVIVYTFEAGDEIWGLSRFGSRIPMKHLAPMVDEVA